MNHAAIQLRHERNYLNRYNDAISEEIMQIRSDVRKIKFMQEVYKWENIINLKKIQDACGSSNIPDDFLKNAPIDLINNIPEKFLQLYYMYSDYPYNAICTHHHTPTGGKFGGKIIIVLDEILFDEKFKSIELRRINSEKQFKLKAGMKLSVYIYEPEIYLPQINFLSHSDFKKTAKILSIDDWGNEFEKYVLVLEIQMTDDLNTEKNIVRRIELADYDALRHFILDD